MKRSSLAVASFVGLLAVVVPGFAGAADPHAAPAVSAGKHEFRTFVPGAAALEGKILAPCCWNQTVDIHGSELSNQIRREIRSRLRAGETADVIQASFVQRYGTKIIAMEADSPLANIALTTLVAIGAVGIAGLFMLKRWRAAGVASRPSGKTKRDDATNDRLDARLDAELRALDE
ncbi:MAG TPA: cytochrome c-type biogenesis protein CcmH [Polyangiaceae bacterium]